MNRKLLTVAVAGVFLLSATGCALVGAGAGRRSECNRIANLSRSGEHKPAADSYDEMAESGRSCSENVAGQVSNSRSKVDRADNFVRKAFKRRKEGNLLSARANLEKALQIYPRYYWVQNLLKNLNKSIEAEINGLKGEARYLESLGDLDGALKRVSEARVLAPGDKALKAETDKLQAAMGRARKENDIKKVLDQADQHMKAGRFEDAERVLTEGDASTRLGPRGQEMLDQVARRRTGLIDQRFSVAREAEQRGDLDVAAGHARYVLELSRPDDATTPDVVEFSRLLGVKLFSAGQLVKARDIWEVAHACDPGNDKLANYLKEVDARLESLEKIRGEDGDAK
jgi:tetratricopeptide (TPR) repeat protein